MPSDSTLLICSLVMAAGLAGLVLAERLRSEALAWLSKPVASAAFVAAAWLAPLAATPYGLWLSVGLTFAALGDVLLIPKQKATFLGGLVAFLVGHVFYAIAFTRLGLHPAVLAATGVAVAGLALVVLRWLWPHVEAPMRAPVLAYVIVISAMVALSAAAFARSAPWQVPLGAALFYASDLAVARERFVAPGVVNRAWGLPTYYGAQLLLASTLWP